MSDVCFRMNGDLVSTLGHFPGAHSQPATTLVKDVLAYTIWPHMSLSCGVTPNDDITSRRKMNAPLRH